MLAGGVSAATVKTLGESRNTCAFADFTIGGIDASRCAGAFGKDGGGGKPANDSNSDLDGLFETSGWTELVTAESDVATNGGVTLNVTGAGTTSGTWSVSGWGGFTTVMAVLKSGPGFSAYLLETTAGTGGTWTTAGLSAGGGPQRQVGIIGPNPRKQHGNIPGLSHMTLYSFDSTTAAAVSDDITGPAPVPLPAGVWLLLAGLGGLAALRRRKSV